MRVSRLPGVRSSLRGCFGVLWTFAVVASFGSLQSNKTPDGEPIDAAHRSAEFIASGSFQAMAQCYASQLAEGLTGSPPGARYCLSAAAIRTSIIASAPRSPSSPAYGAPV